MNFDGQGLGVVNIAGAFWTSFLEFTNIYLGNNLSTNSTLQLYQNSGGASGMDAGLYETTDFTESTLTWNTKPATKDIIDISAVSGGAGWKTINANWISIWNIFMFISY